MSTTSTVLELIAQVQKYIIYINYFIITAGFVGNGLIILVFTKLKLFRGNRCAFYLMVETIPNSIMLSVWFILQTYQLIYGTDPGNLSLIWCKIRTSVTQPCRLFSSSVICFEAFDQFLSTHYQFYIRQMSTLRLARYLTGITYSIWFLQSIPYDIFSEIVPGSGCIFNNTVLLRYYTYVYYVFLNGLLPILTSVCFSLLAYRNVRHLVRLQIPVERRRLDRQLTAMIFARVIAFIVLLTPYTTFRICITSINKSSAYFISGWNQLISVFFECLLLWVYSLSFYVFLATSSRYRRQVKYFFRKKCWQSMKQWCKQNRNIIHPSDGTTVEPSAEIDQ